MKVRHSHNNYPTFPVYLSFVFFSFILSAFHFAVLFLLSTALPPFLLHLFLSYSLCLSVSLRLPPSPPPPLHTLTPPFSFSFLSSLLSHAHSISRSPSLPPLFSLSFSPSISFLSLSPSLHSSPAHSSFSFSSYLPPSFLFLSHSHTLSNTHPVSFFFFPHKYSLSLSDYFKSSNYK